MLDRNELARNLQVSHLPCKFLQVNRLLQETCKILQVNHLSQETCKFLQVNHSVSTRDLSSTLFKEIKIVFSEAIVPSTLNTRGTVEISLYWHASNKFCCFQLEQFFVHCFRLQKEISPAGFEIPDYLISF